MRRGLGLGMGRPRHAPAYMPPESGRLFWRRADAGLTLAGSDISSWADMGSSAVTIAQATGAQQPAYEATGLGGQAAVRGTVAKRLDVTGMTAPAAMTLALVISRSSLGNSTYVLAGTLNSMGIIENFAANTLEWFNGNGTDRLTFAATRTAGPHLVVVTQQNGGLLRGYYDGVQAFSKATAAANLLGIGAMLNTSGGTTNGSNGALGEAIAYSRVWTDDERATFTDYSKSRYGIV